MPLVDIEFLPAGRLSANGARAVGAVDDARPDRWGEKVIRFVDKPKRVSLIEHATMTLAAKAGITVARTQVIALEGAHTIAI